MSEPIRVLLADSAPLLRHALALLLNRRRGLRVVGEAATADETLDLMRSLTPDVVLVEPELPNGGAAFIAEVCQSAPGCAVLILTLGYDHSTASQLLRAGARGYLVRDCEPDELVRTIERVHAGELVVPPAIVAAVVRNLPEEPVGGQLQDALTAREREVLRLVAQGLTNRQIAEELCITEHTSKAHLAKILGKLGLENRVQLTAYAMQNGLADSAESVNGTPGGEGSRSLDQLSPVAHSVSGRDRPSG